MSASKLNDHRHQLLHSFNYIYQFTRDITLPLITFTVLASIDRWRQDPGFFKFIDPGIHRQVETGPWPFYIDNRPWHPLTCRVRTLTSFSLQTLATTDR
jgi:hypothetical protein